MSLRAERETRVALRLTDIYIIRYVIPTDVLSNILGAKSPFYQSLCLLLLNDKKSACGAPGLRSTSGVGRADNASDATPNSQTIMRS